MRSKARHFLFLQGPHGPFFDRLGRMIKLAGAEVSRVGFNRGDQAFWRDKRSYIAFTDQPDEWSAFCANLFDERSITDIVLYGDTRPIHAQAIELAKARGLCIHVFEEGYLRPYWVTYERNGSNGNSALMTQSVSDMKKALAQSHLNVPEAPAHWGDMKQHVFYGAAYHAYVLLANKRYRNFRAHRELTVSQEFTLYLKRLALMPFFWADRLFATARIKNGGYPYHMVLLQLAHDANFRNHSPYSSNSEFLTDVIAGFSKGAPKHHHLVVKAHPLEDGRTNQRGDVRRLAQKAGVAGRVHYVRGGKLASLLDHARSAVTVNSTAAQQVLWRNLPLKVFGRAVYSKPEFVSNQSLVDFFAHPARTDATAYQSYRHYLLETSQIPGGYYAVTGRRQILRQVVDMMLAKEDPYQALSMGKAAPRQHLRIVNQGS